MKQEVNSTWDNTVLEVENLDSVHRKYLIISVLENLKEENLATIICILYICTN